MTPYPFGYDGNPVDPSSPFCTSVPDTTPNPCYLFVDSLAFRAWNRGLATLSPESAGSDTTPYGVWRYNGTRWYPDPTFPGQTVCPGTTILWAGKLDAWLIGPGGLSAESLDPTGNAWPELCRFDGVSDQWEPLPVPKATIADAAPTGTITSGACFAYNDCWFFGTGGAVVHWDGQTLSNASVGPGLQSPWLKSTITSAVAATDAQGNPFALAVAAVDPSGSDAQPDGAPPPQLLSSAGEQFSPLAVSLPAAGESSGSPGTDLDAVAFDAQGDGWIAGNPAAPKGSPTSPFGNPFQDPTLAGPAPLLPISSNGNERPCPSTPSDSFPYSGNGASTSFLWSSIGVMPGGDAVAGGMVGVYPGGDLQTEPVLVQVSCDGSPQETRFRIPDPTASDGGSLIPADGRGYITAVAANAVNDAWAASNAGITGVGAVQGGVYEPPHLYHLTDGQTPDAPAGDDDESRPVVIPTEPTIFTFAPPVVVPAPPPPITVVTRQPARVVKVKLKPPVFDIKPPKVAKAAHGTYTLSISFRVRRKVTIGLEAIRHGKVVSSSGLKTFTGSRGTLVVTLTRKAWPTGLKFVLPKQQ